MSSGICIWGENGEVGIMVRLDVGKKQSKNSEVRPNIDVENEPTYDLRRQL